MKISDGLVIMSAIITFFLISFIITRVVNTVCFNWFDYSMMFLSLFGNMGISILAALGK